MTAEVWTAHRRLYGRATLLELVTAIGRLTSAPDPWAPEHEDARRLAVWLGQREGLGAALVVALELLELQREAAANVMAFEQR